MATKVRKTSKAYKPTKADLVKVEQGASQGLPRIECAKLLTISYSTYKRNTELFEPAYKRGQAECDKFRVNIVEDALFKRASGYSFDEETYERKPIKDDAGKIIDYKMVLTKRVVKQYAPDTTAAIFHLANRDEQRWKSVNKDHDDKNNKYTGRLQFKVIGKTDADS